MSDYIRIKCALIGEVITAHNNKYKYNINNLINFADKNNNLLFWSFAILYRITLDLFYVLSVSPVYSYAGMTLEPDPMKYIISLLIYLVLFKLMSKKEDNFGTFFLHLQFVITIAPMLSYYALNNKSTLYMIMVAICVAIETIIIQKTFKQSNRVEIIGLKNYVTVLIGLLIPTVFIILILYNGFAGFKAFDFEYLYIMRENMSYPPLFGYFIDWITKAIIPFFIGYSLYRNKYKMSLALSLIQIMFFMLLGHKVIILLIPVVLLIYFFAKTRIMIKSIYLGFSILNILGIVIYKMDVHSASLITVLLVALNGIRFLFGPAHNKFLYYDFFLEFPKVFFSDGRIGQIFGLTYPYTAPLGQLIFAKDMGADRFMQSNSNTGYLGDSYAQMGFFGMLLMSVLLAYYVRYLTHSVKKFNYAMMASVFSVMIVALNDGAFITTMLTGGGFVLILLVLIYSEDKGGEKID